MKSFMGTVKKKAGNKDIELIVTLIQQADKNELIQCYSMLKGENY